MAALIRQSCDRCHSQKLRCTRPDAAGTAACSRCLRKRVTCNYSFSLPKGRPKVYNSAQQTRNIHAAAPTANSLPPGPSLDLDSGGDSGIEGGTMAMHVPRSTDAESHSHAPGPMIPDLSDSGLPAQRSIEDPSRDLYMETAVARHFGRLGDGRDIAFDPPSPPALTTRDSSNSSLGGYRPSHLLPRFGSFSASKLADLDHRGSSSSSEEAVVAQLSRMSIRLSRLRALCDAFSTTPSAHRHSFSSRAGRVPGNRSFIDDATFESVASWLLLDAANSNTLSFTATTSATVGRDMHLASSQAGTTTGSMLSHLFSESHALLEILRHMQVDTGLSTSAMPSSIFPSHMAAGGEHTVTRHLVIACHMMLLGIYKLALDVLESEARESRKAEAGALGDIRLASTVQLCCYLTRHHDKAIERFLSDQNYNAEPNSQGFPDVATREEIAKVKADIQDIIVRLNETLA